MAERNAEKRRTEERRITESIEGEKNGKRTNPDPHDCPAGRVGAVVLAAGRGKRMQSRDPKQYMELCGKPLIFYALKAFEDSPQIDEIVLITGPGETEQVRAEIVERFGFYKVSCVAEGGAERYHSVYEGLKCLEGADYVLIHDGARPLVDEGIIFRCVSGAAAFFGTMLSIKPVLHVDDEGHLIPMEKVRGRRQSLDALVEHMAKTGIDNAHQTIFISHGDCKDDVEYVAQQIRQRFGTADIYTNPIGPVIGAHSGPGTLFFLAESRN